MKCMKPSVKNRGIMESGNISVGTPLETEDDIKVKIYRSLV